MGPPLLHRSLLQSILVSGMSSVECLAAHPMLGGL